MTSSSVIKFGTDGWRAIIAEDFTFENVARCSQGLVDYLKDQGTAGRGLVVGYDTRFLSREFAETVAGVCAGNGVKAFLAEKAAPTPVISFNVLEQKAAGAAIITASHNPGIWNGFKFKPEYGGSATQEITDELETKIAAVTAVQSMELEQARREGLVVEIDPDPPYMERLASLVDLGVIKEAGLNILVDAMFGAGGGYIGRLLEGGNTTITEMNGYRNPAFPGMEQPEPIAHNLTGLAQRVQSEAASVGVALDGDADRLGIMDEKGNFVSTLEVFSLLALYLLEGKGQRGDLVKGVTASMMLDKLGEEYGVAVHDMKVGFKYIGPKFSEVDALMGGGRERRIRLSRSHPGAGRNIEWALHPGKHGHHRQDPFGTCGALVCPGWPALLPAAGRGVQPRGPGTDHGTPARPGPDPTGGAAVLRSDEVDGRRLVFDGAWLASRFSGTEPLLRIYCEADSPARVEELLDAASAYLGV